MWLPNASSRDWTTVPKPAAAARVAVGPDGVAYTVNDKGEVWTVKKEGGGQQLSPPGGEFAFDIGVGADGTAWVVSTEARPGGAAPKWLQDAATQAWVVVPKPAAANQIAPELGGEGGSARVARDSVNATVSRSPTWRNPRSRNRRRRATPALPASAELFPACPP